MVSLVRQLYRSRSRISKRMTAEPLQIGARTIRPVVRVSGWRVAGGDAWSVSAGVKLRLEPAGVIIVERDGREHRVQTPDNTRLILWELKGACGERQAMVTTTTV